MKPQAQITLSFSTELVDWTLPLEFQFNQLRDVSAAAERAGYRIFRLKVEAGGYSAQFQRKPAIAVHPVHPFSKTPAK